MRVLLIVEYKLCKLVDLRVFHPVQKLCRRSVPNLQKVAQVHALAALHLVAAVATKDSIQRMALFTKEIRGCVWLYGNALESYTWSTVVFRSEHNRYV
jgi:hypothetical protein